MKFLGFALMTLSLIQNAHALRNSQCMIEVRYTEFDDLFLEKGYYPILTENAEKIGYHPGLIFELSEAPKNDNSGWLLTAKIKDQTGITLFAKTPDSIVYDARLAQRRSISQIVHCDQLPR